MKKLITILLIVIVVAAGLFLLKKRMGDLANAAPPAILPAVVDTAELQIKPLVLSLPSMGVVASDVSAVLSTRISGQVMEVFKREGDAVKKGEQLMRIDAADLEAKRQGVNLQRQGIVFQIEAKRAEVGALEISLKSAEQAHARTNELLDIKGASPEQFSQEEAEIARLKANLAAVRNSMETLRKGMETLDASMREIDALMDYSTLTAPIDGTVSQILVRPGDLTLPGKPLMRIASRSGLYLTISLPGTLHAEEVLLGDQALPLTSKDQTGETGLAQYVAPLPKITGFVEGQFVNVDVAIFRGEGVLVPIDALLTISGSSSVFVLEADGKVRRTAVTVKARGIQGATVEQDLAGSRVVVAKPDILLRIAAGVPVIENEL
jgi:RND family efflux transporter MFP subunit